MDRTSHRYFATSPIDPGELLTGRVPTSQTTTSVRLCYHDTFDWRLHLSGTALVVRTSAESTVLQWERLRAQRVLYAQPVAAVPRFANQVPHPSFADDLAAIAGVRALLPIAELDQTETVFTWGADQDAPIRLVVERERRVRVPGAAPWTALPDSLVLETTSHASAGATLRRVLDDHPALERTRKHPLVAVLLALGRLPGDEALDAVRLLDPGQPAGEAVQALLRDQLYALLRTEDGVRSDLDPEFLHDFRVALRRARALTHLFAPLFDAERLAPMTASMRWLGDQTGPVRDLDVTLMELASCERELGAERAQHLASLRRHLRQRRATEHGRLVDVLSAPRYAELLRAWSSLVEAPVAADQGSIMEFVSDRLAIAYEELQARFVDAGTQDAEALHRARLAGKRLRYLIDLFSSLYPDDDITPPRKALHALQASLGACQDLATHRELAATAFQELQAETTLDDDTVSTFREYEVLLRSRHLLALDAFENEVAHFRDEPVRRAFRRLIRHQPA